LESLLDQGDFEVSESLQREALSMFQQSGDDREVRESLGMMACIEIRRRDYPRARSAFEEPSLFLAEPMTRGHPGRGRQPRHVALRQGHLQEALDFLEEAVPLAHDNFNLEYLSDVLTQLAAVAVRRDHYESAGVILGGQRHSSRTREVSGNQSGASFTRKPCPSFSGNLVIV